MTRFKKGSKEAKAFMAKLRASKKGAKKKKKVSGLKITPKPNVESRLQFGKRGIRVKPIKRKSTSKKRKISGDTHTDTKSHNYRINISGINISEIDNKHLKRLEYLKNELNNAEIELGILRYKKKKGYFKEPEQAINIKRLKQTTTYIPYLKRQIRELKKHI